MGSESQRLIQRDRGWHSRHVVGVDDRGLGTLVVPQRRERRATHGRPEPSAPERRVGSDGFQLTDAMQLLIERGETITTFPITGWFDCGKTETLLETNRELLELKGLTTATTPPGCVVFSRKPVAATAMGRTGATSVFPSFFAISSGFIPMAR